MTALIVNLIAYIVLIYYIYFKEVSRLNFILGNILIVIGAIYIIFRLVIYYKTKTKYKKEIEELQKELENLK